MFRQLDRLLGRQRRIRLAVRAVWMTILVTCFGWVGRNWLGWNMSPLLLVTLGALTLALGCVYAWMPYPGSLALAKSFDDVFDLDAELATALEMSARGRTEGFSTALIERARRHVVLVEREVTARLDEPLRLEFQTLAIMMVLVAGLVLIGGLQADLPSTQALALPPVPALATTVPPPVPGEEPPDVPGEQPGADRPARDEGGAAGETPRLSEEAQQAADAIADALRDQGATRAAADALDRGDPQAAGNELRELADQAEQLSPESRSEIADQLEQAAQQLQQDQPDLAERLQRDANQLRGTPEQAAAGLDDLARALDGLTTAPPELGQNEQPGSSAPTNPQGQPPGSGGEGQGQAENPGSRPGGSGAGNGGNPASRTEPAAPEAPGQTLPLPQGDDLSGPTTPGQGEGATSITLPGERGSGGGREGGSGGTVPDDLSDPSTIPPELRDAIQKYFEHP